MRLDSTVPGGHENCSSVTPGPPGVDKTHMVVVAQQVLKAAENFALALAAISEQKDQFPNSVVLKPMAR